MRTPLIALLAALFVLIAAEIAQADTLVTKDGREFHGRLLEENARQVVLQTKLGPLTFLRDNIASLVRTDRSAALREFPERREALGDNPSAHDALIDWCHRQGLFEQADEIKKLAERFVCSDCRGKGTVDCETCRGLGSPGGICKECKGKQEVRCPQCRGFKRHNCPDCEGRGVIYPPGKSRNGVKCARCANSSILGKVNCEKCQATGKLPCTVCEGQGFMGPPCFVCQRTGKQSCARCGGTGTLGAKTAPDNALQPTPETSANATDEALAPSSSNRRTKTVTPFPARQERRTKYRSGDRLEDAVEGGLRWLQRHQSDDGSWKAKDFHERCNKNPGFPGTCANGNGGEDTGWETTDVGLTGLALLAFLGAGYSTEESLYKEPVERALKFALGVQNPDGSYGRQVEHQGNYNHAIMTQAMAEAYGMTGAPRLKTSVERAVDYIAKARNPGQAWRYGVKPGENDSSVTGWMVLALKSAEIAGIAVDMTCYDGAWVWYNAATDPAYGKVGYMTRGGQQSRLPDKTHYATNEALTAMVGVSRMLMGMNPREKPLQLSADRIVQDPPTWEPETKIDMYYWYWGSLAMFQMGGNHWDQWKEPMQHVLLFHQRLQGKGCVDGSWDPIGAWGSAGGRVYSTAISVLTLETSYRSEHFPASASRRKSR